MEIKRKGQSTLEYIILLAGIVSFMVIFLGRTGFFQQQLNTTYTDTVKSMSTLTGRLQQSYNTQGNGE